MLLLRRAQVSSLICPLQPGRLLSSQLLFPGVGCETRGDVVVVVVVVFVVGGGGGCTSDASVVDVVCCC